MLATAIAGQERYPEILRWAVRRLNAKQLAFRNASSDAYEPAVGGMDGEAEGSVSRSVTGLHEEVKSV